jgi:hypothetical protein
MTPEKRYALNLKEQDRLRNNKPLEETIARNTANVMSNVKNNLSALHNPFNNPFNSQLAKDTNKLMKLNDRKEKLSADMKQMITDLTPAEFDRFESSMIKYRLINV